jgi:hypothetical protein
VEHLSDAVGGGAARRFIRVGRRNP